MMEIYKSFTFDAAHRLPSVPAGHKCAGMHGHTYQAIVRVRGEPAPHSGWIIDFADIAGAVKPVLARLDHKVLNEIEGLENPTAENLCVWLWKRIGDRLAPRELLYEIHVKESADTGCIYRGPS